MNVWRKLQCVIQVERDNKLREKYALMDKRNLPICVRCWLGSMKLKHWIGLDIFHQAYLNWQKGKKLCFLDWRSLHEEFIQDGSMDDYYCPDWVDYKTYQFKVPDECPFILEQTLTDEAINKL